MGVDHGRGAVRDRRVPRGAETGEESVRERHGAHGRSGRRIGGGIRCRLGIGIRTGIGIGIGVGIGIGSGIGIGIGSGIGIGIGLGSRFRRRGEHCRLRRRRCGRQSQPARRRRHHRRRHLLRPRSRRLRSRHQHRLSTQHAVRGRSHRRRLDRLLHLQRADGDAGWRLLQQRRDRELPAELDLLRLRVPNALLLRRRLRGGKVLC